MDSNTLLGQYKQFTDTRANPTTLYDKAQNELGVGEVRGRVGNLRTSLLNTENLLNNVEGSVQGRTQGSLVTEAQRQRLTALERNPIMSQYNKLSGDYGKEDANLKDLLGQASQRSQMGYQADTDKGNSIFQMYQAAMGKEAEARRQAEADRAYAESVRQFNAQMAAAQAQAQRAAASARSSGGGGSTAAKSAGNVDTQIVSRIQQAVAKGASWGAIASELDRAFGKGTATRFDQQLKVLIGQREGNVGKYFGR